MVKRILAVFCISFNDFKAIVMSIYNNLVLVTDTIMQQGMYTENCEMHS